MSMEINNDYSNLGANKTLLNTELKAHEAQDLIDETEITQETAKSAYVSGQSAIDTHRIKSLKHQFQARNDVFQQMVVKLFRNMGMAVDSSLYDIADADEYANLKEKIAELDVDDETRAQAQELIGDDGYYSAGDTSSRILDFAKALSGGDVSKMEVLREAVEKGFEQAESAWGGSLPDICRSTYDMLMRGFEDWEKDELEENPMEVDA